MRMAVLGCGSIGCRHLRNLRALGVQDLVAFDPAAAACKILDHEPAAPLFTDLEALWATRPDVVFIAAPSNLHIPLALEAARRGCHLFIEKPLSHSREGIDFLAAEADRGRLVTLVACNMRFHPGPALIKQLLDEGAIGTVIAARIQNGSFLPRWRPRQDYHQSYSASPEFGGAVLDCIHEIDLALWYFGGAKVVAGVCSPASHIDLATDGLAEILLRHDSGVLSNVHLNFVQRDERRSCQIIGSTGTLYWDHSDRRVLLFGSEGTLDRSFSEPDGWRTNQMYLDELAYLLECVQANRPTFNPIAGGLAALDIALEVNRPGLRAVAR
jgi:predicted dehydrogenase